MTGGQPRPAAGSPLLRPAAGSQHVPATADSPPVPLAVRADDRQATVRPVSCARCGAVVMAAKFSPQHTSVQWTPAAVRTCAEFTARVAGGEQTALIDTCASLHRSIDQAARAGRLPVAPP
jgi:hypothetical protein